MTKSNLAGRSGRLTVPAVLLVVAFQVLALTSCRAAPPLPSLTGETPVKADNIDAQSYAQWDNGEEKPLHGSPDRTPAWVLWTDRGMLGYNGFTYGDSKTTGARHLRIGFKSPIPVGTVMVRGGGQLSVLKPGAVYPGDMTDESQWL